MDRRGFLSVLGAGVVTGGAGCLSTDQPGRTATQEREIEPTQSQLSAGEFRTRAAKTHEKYQEGGIWGTAESEPAHELTYQGAWSQTLAHQGAVSSEHLLALFRLPPGPNGAASSQVWLWSGIDPKDTGSVRRIKTGIALPRDGPRIGIYSPGQDIHADETTAYAVESGRLDVATLRATIPLSDGQIGFGEQTQVGEAGAYFPYWEGENDRAQTVAATTEIRWQEHETADLTWGVEVVMGA